MRNGDRYANFSYLCFYNKIIEIMVFINLKELRQLKEHMSVMQLAKHYKVDLFDLHNFIFSHEGRNGTYPVDGKRDRSPVKARHDYPSKNALVNKLKHKTIGQVANELGISYNSLQRYAKKLDIKVGTKTLNTSKNPKKERTPAKEPVTFDDMFKALKNDPNSIVNKLR